MTPTMTTPTDIFFSSQQAVAKSHERGLLLKQFSGPYTVESPPVQGPISKQQLSKESSFPTESLYTISKPHERGLSYQHVNCYYCDQVIDPLRSKTFKIRFARYFCKLCVSFNIADNIPIEPCRYFKEFGWSCVYPESCLHCSTWEEEEPPTPTDDVLARYETIIDNPDSLIRPSNSTNRRSSTFESPDRTHNLRKRVRISPEKDVIIPQGDIFPSLKAGIDEPSRDFIQDIFAQAKEMISGLSSKVPGILERQRFLAAVEKLAEVADSTKEFDLQAQAKTVLSLLKTEVKDSAKGLSTAKNLVLVGAFASSVLYYLNEPSNMKLGLVCMSGLACLLFTDVINFPSLWTKIVEYFSKIKPKPVEKDFIVPQMTDGDMDDAITGLSGLFATYISCTSGTHIPTSLFKNFSNLGRVKTTLSEVMKVISKCIEDVYNFMRNKIFDLPNIRFFDIANEEIDAYMKEIDVIFEEYRMKVFHIDQPNLLRIDAAIMTGKALLKNIKRDANSAGALSLLQAEYSKLLKIKEVFNGNNLNSSGSRQEPVCVVFKGGPGTGKSIAMECLNYAVLSATLNDKDFDSFKADSSTFTYNRQAENKYWDGYSINKRSVYFDDFGQARDIAGQPDNEYLNLIRACNMFQNDLHMASMDQKGCVTFQSEFVFLTTNLVEFQPQSIISPLALTRRFDLIFTVVPKPEFCTPETVEGDLFSRKFDETKLPLDCVEIQGHYLPGKRWTTKLNPSMQHFHLMDRNGMAVGGYPLEFDDVVKMTLRSYDAKRTQFQLAQLHFKTLVDKYRNIYSTEPQADIPMESMESSQEFHSTTSSTYRPANIEDILQRLDAKKDQKKIREVKDMFFDISGYDPDIIEMCKHVLVLWSNLTDEERQVRKTEFNQRAYSFFGPTISNRHSTPVLICGGLVAFGKEFCVGLLDGDWRHFDIVYAESHTCGYGDYEDFPYCYPLIVFTTSPRDFSKMCWSLVQRHMENCHSGYYVEAMKTFLFDYWPIISIAVVLGITWFANSVYKRSIFPELEVEGQSFNSSDKMAQKHTNRTFIRSSRTAKALIATHPQGGALADGSGCDLVKSIMASSLFSMYQETTGGWKQVGCVFFVRGRVAMMPYHFIARYLDLVDEEIKRGGDHGHELHRHIRLCKGDPLTSFQYEITVADLIAGHVTESADGKVQSLLTESDLVLVMMPKVVQPRKDRVENFAKRTDYNRLVANIPFVLEMLHDGVRRVQTGIAFSNDKVVDVKFSEKQYYCLRESYEYDNFTSIGDCGSMFCAMNASIPNRKIFGMHTAGSTHPSGRAYASAVCQEDLLHDLALFDEKIVYQAEGPDDLVQVDEIVGQGQFNNLGAVPKFPNAVQKTDLAMSRMFEDWKPSLVKPAHLGKFKIDGKTIDPLPLAQSKYGFVAPRVSQDTLDDVKEEFFDDLLVQSKVIVNARIFSTEEVLYGAEGEELMRGVSSGTSPGYPMNVPGQRNLKKELFANPREHSTSMKILEEVKERVEEMEVSYASGVYPVVVYTDNLKDEKREREKVDAGKTRQFSGCPFIYLLLQRKYFGAFCAWIQANKISNGMCVGVNPYSDDWTEIVRKLGRFEPTLKGGIKVGAGDFSAYDGHQFIVFHLAILWMMQEWYKVFDPNWSQRDHDIREGLYSALLTSVHVTHGCIYEMNGNMVSGWFGTAVFNCIYNILCFRYIWRVTVRIKFLIGVILFVMGDDNLFTVREDFRHLFNEETLPGLFKMVGMVYTTETKGVANSPFRLLTSVEFLKRGFRYDVLTNSWLAPLRLDTVLEIPYWSKRGADFISISASNTIEALRELSLHPREVHDEWAPKIQKSFETRYRCIETPSPLRMSYHSRQAEVRNLEQYYC